MIQLVRPSRGHTTQFYGNIQPDGNPHAGEDYAYTNGAEIFPEVYAAADGVVLFAGDSRGLAWPNIMYVNIDFDRTDNVDSSAGNYVIIEHRINGVRVALTGYGHLESYSVQTGQTVSAAQRIGTVGATGFSFGKHLHFDLVVAPFRVDIAPYYGRVDPKPYFVSGITLQGTITPLQEEGFLMALTDQQQKDLHYAICTDEGRQIHAQKFADVVFRTSLKMLDGGRPTFEEVLAVSNDRLGHIKRSTDLLQPLDVDVRGDLANKGAQLAALAAANGQLAALLAEKQGLSVDEIRAAIAGAVADGIKVTVSVDGGDSK
jgi:hypothetical protein